MLMGLELLLELLASFDDKVVVLMTWSSSDIVCLNALHWHLFSEMNNYEISHPSSISTSSLTYENNPWVLLE
jgi:hypothetical protein